MASVARYRIGTRAGMAFVALLIAGCVNLAPHYERPPAELPADWGGLGKPAASGDTWWRVYGDAQLDRLIDEALLHNANLALAVARIDEARAQLGFARAEQFPTVGATLGRARSNFSERSAIPVDAGAPRLSDNYRATLDTAYELDLWGRLRNTRRAAQAELLASEAAAQTVRMTLAADVAQAYFALHALDGQVTATERTLEARSEALALQKMRYDVGAISAFEYRQLEAETLAARAASSAGTTPRARGNGASGFARQKSPRHFQRGANRANGECGNR